MRIVLQDLAVGMGRGPPPPSGTHGSQGAWEGGGVGSREGEADVGSEALPELVEELRTPENCAVSRQVILYYNISWNQVQWLLVSDLVLILVVQYTPAVSTVPVLSTDCLPKSIPSLIRTRLPCLQQR